ncbi:FliH/SctL family protein [Silanimonas sp.]|uniref:FliH/SctL family protein n=1 Tax=Silanimonas sp. TaxID=1929290 RepID=UPI0037CA57BC
MSDAAALWRVPALDAPPPPKPPSIDELQRIEDAARKEGFEAGRREGMKAGEAEVRKLVAQIEGVVEAMARPLGRLDDEVHAALGQMAVRIAGALIGRAYEADPELLAQLVRTAIDAVGPGQRDIELRVHPEDAKVLQPWLPQWPDARVITDAQLARGDVRIHGDGVRIDARTDSRLQAALAAVLNPIGGAQ